MDLLLLILGFICTILGVIGSFIPVIPGLSLCWIGLLLLYTTSAIPTNLWVLGLSFVLVLIITLLEYIIPAQGTKRFGGSKYGIWGTNIGLLIGLIAPIPFGFIIGPFIGAFVGELIYDSTNHQRALKAATGSFIGFLATTFMNFILCMVFLGGFLFLVWKHWENFI